MQLPAAKASLSVCLLSVKASGPRPKKCWLLTLHPPASACRMVTCVNPCQCLTLLSDPMKKSRKMPAARGQSQLHPRAPKKMLADLTLHPPAGSAVSNGYLCQPLPVPNVAF